MKSISTADHPQLPGVLIGNKVDLENQRIVQAKEGRIYANLIGWRFFETSAKTGANVKDVFTLIAKELYSNHPPVRRKK